jgi:hypothetical protein
MNGDSRNGSQYPSHKKPKSDLRRTYAFRGYQCPDWKKNLGQSEDRRILVSPSTGHIWILRAMVSLYSNKGDK